MNGKRKYEKPLLSGLKSADALGTLKAAADKGDASVSGVLAVIARFEMPGTSAVPPNTPVGQRSGATRVS